MADEGDNPLLVVQEDSHSAEPMLRTYAAWDQGAKPEDIERMKKAMAGRPSTNGVGDDSSSANPTSLQFWPPQSRLTD